MRECSHRRSGRTNWFCNRTLPQASRIRADTHRDGAAPRRRLPSPRPDRTSTRRPMDVAEAPVSRTVHRRFMSAASSTSRADEGVPGNAGASAAARCADSMATAWSVAPNSTISHALPAGRSAMSASARPRSRKPPTMPVSSPSIAIGDNGSSCGTQSAASKIVGKPYTTITRCTGLVTSVVFARSIETKVPSDPTSAARYRSRSPAATGRGCNPTRGV